MTIIQSLITKLEKINNGVLIERLEILERFVSARETNRLLEERKNENSKQIIDIFGEKEPVVNNNDDNEEVIEKKDIIDKFKWVMIGIGVFVLLIFIISILFWYVSLPSVPIEATEPVGSISNNEMLHAQIATPAKVDTVYSYLPNIFQNDKINETDTLVIEKRENERKLLEIQEQERLIEQERLKSQVKERFIESEEIKLRESDKFNENYKKDLQDKEKSYFSFNYFDKPIEEEKSKSYAKDYDRSTSHPKEEEISKSYTKDYDRSTSHPKEEEISKSYTKDYDRATPYPKEEEISKSYPKDYYRATPYPKEEDKTDSETSSDEDKTDSETSSDENKTDSESSSDEDKNLDNFKSSKLSLSQNNRDNLYEISSNKKGLEPTIRKPIGGKNNKK